MNKSDSKVDVKGLTAIIEGHDTDSAEARQVTANITDVRQLWLLAKMRDCARHTHQTAKIQ